MFPLGSLHLLQSLWGRVECCTLIWFVFHSLQWSFPSFKYRLCKCESGNTMYLCCLFQSFLFLLDTDYFGILTVTLPEVAVCSVFNIVWGFWKAQWDTEWAPLSLITVHLLKSSGARLLPISFSYRFFFRVTPMEALEIIFQGTGLSTRKLLPNDSFYFDVCMMLSILMGLGCSIFFIYV